MKTSKVIYWISTGFVLLLVGAGSFADLLRIDPIRESFQHIGFPEYMMPFFGIVKLLGSIGILLPARKVLKEWSYAGIVFYFIGANYVHIAIGDGLDKIILTLFILFVVAISYVYSKKVEAVAGN